MSSEITKLIVAVLGGTGKEGPGLAMRWAHVGYKVIIGSRQLEKAQRIAKELNEKLALDTITGLENGDAARHADISVLTVVATANKPALQGLVHDLQGKILVDATARVDFRDPRPPDPPAAARIAQDILGPGTRVVAAFQNVPAHTLRTKLGQPLHTDVMVCADDVDAAEQVIQLVQAGGMRAFYTGGLDNAVIVEGLTALLIGMNKYYGTKTASIGISGIEAE